jgi:hypothetical protein
LTRLVMHRAATDWYPATRCAEDSAYYSSIWPFAPVGVGCFYAFPVPAK